jgi:hypothetical protein
MGRRRGRDGVSQPTASTKSPPRNSTRAPPAALSVTTTGRSLSAGGWVRGGGVRERPVVVNVQDVDGPIVVGRPVANRYLGFVYSRGSERPRVRWHRYAGVIDDSRGIRQRVVGGDTPVGRGDRAAGERRPSCLRVGEGDAEVTAVDDGRPDGRSGPTAYYTSLNISWYYQ